MRRRKDYRTMSIVSYEMSTRVLRLVLFEAARAVRVDPDRREALVDILPPLRPAFRVEAQAHVP